MFTIGTDAEVFLKDFNNEFVASCGLFGGTKEQPIQFKGSPAGQMYQEDNVALEFNIPVCDSGLRFRRNVKETLAKVELLAAGRSLLVSRDSVAFFKKDALSHPNALIFGCEPDYNAWKLIKNKRPQLPKSRVNMRTAAAHVHIGTHENIIDVAKRLDLFLGVPSILLTEKTLRRTLYGKAGDIRPKPYGLEYRTLDNFWIFKDSLIDWVYKGVERSILDKDVDAHIDIFGKTIQKCINTHDKALAEELVKEFNIQMPVSNAHIIIDDIF